MAGLIETCTLSPFFQYLYEVDARYQHICTCYLGSALAGAGQNVAYLVDCCTFSRSEQATGRADRAQQKGTHGLQINEWLTNKTPDYYCLLLINTMRVLYIICTFTNSLNISRRPVSMGKHANC
jgi:hypothetical protein